MSTMSDEIVTLSSSPLPPICMNHDDTAIAPKTETHTMNIISPCLELILDHFITMSLDTTQPNTSSDGSSVTAATTTTTSIITTTATTTTSYVEEYELLQCTNVQNQLIHFLQQHHTPSISSSSLQPQQQPWSYIHHTNITGTTNNNSSSCMMVPSLSHLLIACRELFYDRALTSTSKETRIQLRRWAASITTSTSLPTRNKETTTTTTISPITTTSSILTLSLMLMSLSVQTKNVSTIEQQKQQQHACRSAASAIGSTLEDLLRTHSRFVSNESIVFIRRVVLSILLVHRDFVMNRSNGTVSNIYTNTMTSNPSSSVAATRVVATTSIFTNNDSAVYIDLQIVTNLARILGMDDCYFCGGSTDSTNSHHHTNRKLDPLLSDVVTFAIVNGLQLLSTDRNPNHQCDDTILNDTNNGWTSGVPLGQNGKDIKSSSEANTSDRASSVIQNSPVSIEEPNTNFDSLTTVLSLASQFRPWHQIDPITLVRIAMDHMLWHSAEKICTSVTTCDPLLLSNATIGIDTVSTYIDLALQRRAHRQADKIATAFFDALTMPDTDLLEEYFLNARYLHACNTITKLIRKGAIPVIERQVERIDQSVLKIKDHRTRNNITSNCNMNVEPFYEGGTTLECASTNIRNFALQKLEENEDMDSAQRLAKLWEMDYVYDPEVMKLAEQRRKQLYLQWEDAFPHQPNIPDLITTPQELDQAMLMELGVNHHVYGFDVEWGNDDDTGIVGAAVLQIATVDRVILVDIPALSKTISGVEALERHIQALFHNPNIKMIGFSCREDLSKLRSSPCIRKERHWFQSDHISSGSSSSVVDLQSIIAQLKIEQLPKEYFGLSKVSEYYLMKPLDKSEQCSEWNQRPLRMRQRIYAALDAYVCVMVYTKLMQMKS